MTSIYTEVVGFGTDDDGDAELVCAHLAGDPEAFEHIVRRYTPLLLTVARRRLGSQSDAEDAVQDCLERAYKGIFHLRAAGSDCRLRPWLLRILANVCTDFITRRQRQRDISGRVAARRIEPDWIDYEVRDPAATRTLGAALADLPNSQREAFLLRELRGFAYPTVAALTGASEDNARARVHRARRALQRRLTSFQASGIAAMVFLAGRKRGLLSFPRRVSDVATRLLLVQSPEVVGTSSGSTAVAVFTVAAGIASVGGGVVNMMPPAGSATPAPSHAAAPSQVVPVVPSAASTAPVIAPVATAPSTANPQLQLEGEALSPLGLRAPAPIAPSKPTPPASDQTATTGGSGNTSTTVPVTTPPPAAAPVDLTWVSTAETDGAPGPSPAGTTSSSSAPATPSAACSGLSSMPGPGIPTSPPASLAGLHVTQLVTGVQPAQESAGGFMIFASLGDLFSEVGGPAHTQVRVAADVCMTAPTQVMVADITIPGQQAGMLQLRGTLVATTSSLGEQGGFFRGAVVPLSPVSGALRDLPTDFVGEVSCETASSTCSLTIALVSDPPSTSSTDSTTTTSTTTPTSVSGTSSSGTTDTPTSGDSSGGAGVAASGATKAPSGGTIYPQPSKWPAYPVAADGAMYPGPTYSPPPPPPSWFDQAAPTSYVAASASS